MEFGKRSTLGGEARRCFDAIALAASSAPAEEREDARCTALWLAGRVRDLSDGGRAMDNWLYPRGGRVWAWACDSHSECAFDLSSRAGTSWAGDPSPVGVPRDALLALAGRSPRGGVRVEADGGSLSVSALSSGYTGRVSASRPSPFEAMAAPPEVEGLIGKTMAARGEAVSGGAGEGLEAVASAADLGRAFSCLGARLRHSRHAPAVVRVDRAGRVVAVEGLGGQGCVMRCAGRPWGDGL